MNSSALSYNNSSKQTMLLPTLDNGKYSEREKINK